MYGLWGMWELGMDFPMRQLVYNQCIILASVNSKIVVTAPSLPSSFLLVVSYSITIVISVFNPPPPPTSQGTRYPHSLKY